MEHDKLDKNIKRKLEKREVAPKETTWNRLETLLEEDEKKTRTPMFFKYAVAASVVLFLGMFWVLKIWEKPVTPTPQIVRGPKVEANENEDGKTINKTIEIKTNAIANTNKTVTATLDNIVAAQKRPVQVVATKQTRAIKPSNTLATLNTSIAKNNTGLLNETKATIVKGNSFEQEKLSKRGTVNTNSTNEVDALLADAMAANQKEQSNTLVLDKNLEANANALLENVEQELDESFKEKIFKKIKNGLRNTGTAINNRNK